MFYPLGKNSKKPYGKGGGASTHPLYVQGLKYTQLKTHIVRKSALRFAKI